MRAIDINSGSIFEGNLDEEGRPDGWGVEYCGIYRSIIIGWYKQGKQEGNSCELNSDWSSIFAPSQHFWYSNGHIVGPAKMNSKVYKHFDL